MIKHFFLPYLSDKTPNAVAPINLPSDTATATAVRQKLFSQTRFHCNEANIEIFYIPLN